jgi:4-amino-4-deoxy-L-arabinose transferase-like glycosyltransferase
MLFIPPILLGMENAARLIHLEFGLLLGLGVYALARQLFDSRAGAWLALFALGTTPVIGTVGGYAHTDLGWVLFEFLAVYALLCWASEGERRWLLLAAIFAGLGMGSRYHGVLGLGALSVAVAVLGFWQRRGLSRQAWQHILTDGLLFTAVALVIASPWYLKNWLWLGNPLYPTAFGGRGWDAYRSANLAFMGTRYGPRRGLLGLLLLPWDLFRYPVGYFGPIPFAFPTPVCLLLPLYLFVRRRPFINLILLVVGLRFGTWVVSARNARYLMDTYPLLSVAVAYLLMELSGRRVTRALIRGMVFVLLVAALSWQCLLLLQEGPIPVVLGLESREEYLVEHNQPPYQAIRFINQLTPDSRVFFVGNGQSYYVTVDHVADVSHGNWGHLMYKSGEEPSRLHEALVHRGITHVYYSGYDFAWRLNFDFEGELAHELDVFERFVDQCAVPVYDQGENGQVFVLLGQCED